MINESLLGELENSFILAVNYHENYANYKARLMVPLFKHDTEPYVLEVNDADFPNFEVNIDSQHLDSLKSSGSSWFVNRLIHASRHSSYSDATYTSEHQISPFFYRVAKENKETISEYLDTFCKYILEPQISKHIPLNVYFDGSEFTINFKIPFVDITPGLPLSSVLHCWDTTDKFIEEIIKALSKIIPSKNKKLFS